VAAQTGSPGRLQRAVAAVFYYRLRLGKDGVCIAKAFE
jgi:hypothetical protein